MVRKLLIGLVALSLSACGDPLVIIGDLPGFMRITAGIPDSIGIRTDSNALRSRLTHPAGLAISKEGVLYFGDQSSRIISVTSSGKLTVLHESLNCFDKTCLGRPQGLGINPEGNTLYLADDMSDKIWRFTLSNRELSVVAGTGVNGVSPDGTPGPSAKLASPNGLAVLPDGRVAFAERNSYRVRVIGSDGILRTLAGNGTQGEATDGAQATAAPLNVPTGLAYGDNTIFVSETGSSTVRAIDLATGTIRKVAGTGAAGFSGDGGPATSAVLNNPTALAYEGKNLYIADQGNDRIRIVNLETGGIATFAGTGSRIFSGNGRAAAETSLYFPNGLAVSSFGYLYISDYGHNVVWRTPIRATLQ